LGEFSKTNWGDKTELREGRQVTVNTTSGLDVIVGKLKSSQWEKILTAALDACQSTRKAATVDDVIDVDADESPSADFDLVDNDSE
jgi:hypothetical protein